MLTNDIVRYTSIEQKHNFLNLLKYETIIFSLSIKHLPFDYTTTGWLEKKIIRSIGFAGKEPNTIELKKHIEYVVNSCIGIQKHNYPGSMIVKKLISKTISIKPNNYDIDKDLVGRIRLVENQKKSLQDGLLLTEKEINRFLINKENSEFSKMLLDIIKQEIKSREKND